MKLYSRYAKQGVAVLILALFLLIGCAAAEPDENKTIGIDIESAADITAEEIADFQRSSGETLQYYREIGLVLHKPIMIALTRNRSAFLKGAAQRFGVSEFEINRVARGVDALAGNGIIVINVEGTPTPRQRAFLLAHEVTHQYQRQLAGGRASENMWMLEGMAEAVGAQIVARQGYMTMNQYRANWEGGLRNAKNKPMLSELRTSRDWSVAMSLYGSAYTYKTAGLSNLLLAEQHGMGCILQYFARLGNGDTATDAFQKAFGVDMLDFEQEIDNLLRKAS